MGRGSQDLGILVLWVSRFGERVERGERGEGDKWGWGNDRPLMEHMLQLHSQISTSRGARMENLTDWQWQAPVWMIFSVIVAMTLGLGSGMSKFLENSRS